MPADTQVEAVEVDRGLLEHLCLEPAPEMPAGIAQLLRTTLLLLPRLPLQSRPLSRLR